MEFNKKTFESYLRNDTLMAIGYILSCKNIDLIEIDKIIDLITKENKKK